MKELLDYNASGYLFEDEEVVVESGNINLLHDTIKANSVTIYFDLAHTLPIVDFDLTQYDTEIQQYRAIAFTEDFVTDHADEVVYVTYTTYGDIVKAEDINETSKKFEYYICGETINIMDCFYLDDQGIAYIASNTNLDIISKNIYIAMSSAISGRKVKGWITGEAITAISFDPEKPIFLGNGRPVQIMPTSGFIKILAYPITATLFRKIELPSIRVKEI